MLYSAPFGQRSGLVDGAICDCCGNGEWIEAMSGMNKY